MKTGTLPSSLTLNVRLACPVFIQRDTAHGSRWISLALLLQVMVATGGATTPVPGRRGAAFVPPSAPAAGVPALCRSRRGLGAGAGVSDLRAIADGSECGIRRKVAIIGAGNVGGTTAFCLAQQGIADILLMDIDEGVAKGKALDIAQSLGIGSASCSVSGSCSYGDVSGSDVVVVTCGLARRPGMSRDDLISLNAGIVSQAAAGMTYSSSW